ncbi:molecular chaperone HtpG [bacterium]|nr:molecular chaperone HtpG [bacterium]
MPKEQTTKKTNDIKKGEISIHTENIFPIIKKWLYSDHEIFLRELASNAFDATTKLQKLAALEDIKDLKEPNINIIIDEKKKTITFADTGLGMDAEEVEKYITQIAFSGAEEFVQKIKENDSKDKSEIIGHFGLGFYSSFMVADLVEINSKSYKKDAEAIFWSCTGSTDYTIKKSDKKEIGTDIILHINDENKEYLNETKIKDLVKKYTNFLPINIQVNGVTANEKNPLWIKTPKDVKEEDYKEFYQKLFPYNGDPLFWIHLNVDYPFNLQGILYFPKVMHELDSNKGQVKLFCKQVFVSDNANAIIPEFLTLLQGAIDCPDIPLNVSRSYLQNDPYVQKISKHIIKKVADKLNDLAKKDKNHFESIWNDISPFIKYGMMQNDDFYTKVKDIIIFESSLGYKTSIPEYLERNKEKIKDKVIYCSDKDGQATYVNMCKDQDVEVLFTHALIDTHFLQFLESKDSTTKYCSVDSELSDLLVDENKKTEVVDQDNKTNNDKLADIFKKALNNDKIKVDIKALKSTTISGMILESEHVKRMKNMSHFMQDKGTGIFDDFTLVVNNNNELVKDLMALNTSSEKEPLVTKLCHHIYDLAKMSKQPLTGEETQSFINRSNELMKELTTAKTK